MTKKSQTKPEALANSPLLATSLAKPKAPATSKADLILKKLRGTKGASLQQLSDVTGWQLHSVRGFLSANIRKKLGLNLISDVGKDEVRRYRIVEKAEGASS